MCQWGEGEAALAAGVLQRGLLASTCPLAVEKPWQRSGLASLLPQRKCSMDFGPAVRDLSHRQEEELWLTVLVFLPRLSGREVISFSDTCDSEVVFFAWCSWERHCGGDSKLYVMGRTLLYPEKVKVQDSSCLTQLQSLLLLPYLTCLKSRIALCFFMYLHWQIPLTDCTGFLSMPSILHGSISVAQGLSKMAKEIRWTGTEWKLSREWKGRKVIL